ncbi:MAG TPA: redoxin domain-containing protein [Anaerolineae bacterium]|nr:redoxin domain-containing protein [Anaerolineae bacterium]HIP71657.1 redoxin domain-containing protein [Anaerolineae bacterium]
MSRKRKRIAARKKKQRQQRLYTIIGVVGLVLLLGAVIFAVNNSQESSGNTAGRATAVSVGAVAPDFELVSISGEPVKLSDYQGRPVAVTFMHTW